MNRSVTPRWLRGLTLLVALATSGSLSAQLFEDRFDRADGPLDGWTVDGDWNIVSGRLVASAATGFGDQHAYIGERAVLPRIFTISFDWNFPDVTSRRAAGVLFNCNRPGRIGSEDTSGYLVSWTDVGSEGGLLKLLRYEEGGFTAELGGQDAGDLSEDPPAHVDIEVDNGVIRAYGDGVLAFEITDHRYWNGTAGLWVSGSGGNQVEFDNFVVEGALFQDDFEHGEDIFSQFSRWWISPRERHEWSTAEGKLLVGAPSGTTVETQAFARRQLPADVAVTLDWRFLSRGSDASVGRHAGVFLHFDEWGDRRDPGTSGYQLYWIDRAGDRGLSLVRWDERQFRVLSEGTGRPDAEPPDSLRVEFSGERIRVWGDDVLAIDVFDARYRGGLFGLWAWNNGQEVEFDNVRIQGPADEPCFRMSPYPYVFGRPITFDAACSVGEFQAPVWTFDSRALADRCNRPVVDRAGVVVTYAFEDYSILGNPLWFTIGLSLLNTNGLRYCAWRSIELGRVVTDLIEDFRSDGVSSWDEASGDTWEFRDDALRAGAGGGTTEQHWIWARSRDSSGPQPRLVAPPNVSFDFEYRFLTRPPGEVGRHGGFQFHCRETTTRDSFSGYYIDWIDRDRSLRLIRQDAGVLGSLWANIRFDQLEDPPVFYRVETDGERIRVWGDDILRFDVFDATYRGGYFGFWTYREGQRVEIDNLVVRGSELTPCFEIVDRFEAFSGSPVTFDGTCSSVYAGDAEIETYRWYFGDGHSVTGSVVEHVYDEPGEYEVRLELLSSGRRAASSATTLVVRRGAEAGSQRPADCNQDGKLDISDGICLLGYLFLGNPTSLPCGDGTPAHLSNLMLLDYNGDSIVDLSDPVAVLNFLFLGGPPPAEGKECVSIAGCEDVCSD